MACVPSEDSDQPGICPVWAESSLSTWRKLGYLQCSYPLSAQQRLISDWADAQVHTCRFVGFVMRWGSNKVLHSIGLTHWKIKNLQNYFIEFVNWRSDSSVSNTVCLCLMTSYIPLPQGFESWWQHGRKHFEWWKNYISENPCGMWVVWLSLLGCGGFTEYFPGSRELPWLSSTSRQSCKMCL